jgi:ribosomal-protein-alanine N-acetyltransferase
MGHEYQARAAGQAEAAESRPAGRVILRRIASGGEAEFLELVRASAGLYRPWMSLASTAEEFQAYLGRYRQSGEESLLVCLRSTGAIAGVVNVNSIIRGRSSVARSAMPPSRLPQARVT